MQPPPHAKPAVPDAHFVQRGHVANLRHRRSVAAVVPGLETVLEVPRLVGLPRTGSVRRRALVPLSKPPRESNINWTLCLVHFSRMGRAGHCAEPTADGVTRPAADAGLASCARSARTVTAARGVLWPGRRQRGIGGPVFGVLAVARCRAELGSGGRVDLVRGAPEHESQLPHCGPHRAPAGVDVG